MTVIVAVHGELPPQRYTQNEITEALLKTPDFAAQEQMVRSAHASSKDHNRHLVLPLEDYAKSVDRGGLNDLFVEHAVKLGCTAVNGALVKAGLTPSDVDILLTTTVTGHAVPTLNALLCKELGLRPDVRRVPLFGPGFGDAAGAAGIARLHDYLRGDSNSVGVLLTVELCSLTLKTKPSNATLVGSAHFGDGAAALVAIGDHRADNMLQYGPVIVDSRSQVYADSLHTMGWDSDPDGLQLPASDIPTTIVHHFSSDVETLLASQELTVADVSAWVSHPGGQATIDAITESLHLPNEALELARRSLGDVGNLPSASVLHVLSDTIATRPPMGTPGVLMAIGSGFCSEIVLLRWE
jgi:alkylresorcinol/alkylpyrone synthase